MVLLGSSTVPINGFRVILWHTRAATMNAAQYVLHPGNAMFGSSRQPLYCFCIIVRNDDSPLISNAQDALRPDVIGASFFNQFGNLLRSEREHLIFYLDFQNCRALRQLN